MARISTSKTSASARPRRKTLSERHKIRVEIPENDGFHYRMANAMGDNGFRVQNLQDIGYEVVPHTDAARTGDESVSNPSPMGSNGTSLGRGDKGILMRITDEFYEEDQKAKAALADAHDQGMKDSAKAAADYGSINFDVTK